MSSKFFSFELSLLYCLAALAIGCGSGSGEATVTGTVLMDGQLVDGGTITFHPVTGGPPATGRIRKDGSFSVRSGQGNLKDADSGTLQTGDYKITIVVLGPSLGSETPAGPPPAGPRLSAEKYASQSTTDLQRTVVAGKNLFEFHLDRSEPVAEDPNQDASTGPEATDETPAENVEADNAPEEASGSGPTTGQDSNTSSDDTAGNSPEASPAKAVDSKSQEDES